MLDRGAFITDISHVSSYKSNSSSFANSSSLPMVLNIIVSTITICKVDVYDDQSSYTTMRHFPMPRKKMPMEQFQQPPVHQNSVGLIKSDTKEGAVIPIQRLFQMATLKRLQQRRVLIKSRHMDKCGLSCTHLL